MKNKSIQKANAIGEAVADIIFVLTDITIGFLLCDLTRDVQHPLVTAVTLTAFLWACWKRKVIT